MISERFQCQSFQEVQESLQEQLQDQSFQKVRGLSELQEVFFSNMSACEQEQSCLNMSACAVGTVMSEATGTMCVEMLSQLKEVASSLLERSGVVFPQGSTVLPQGTLQQDSLSGTAAMESASASDASSVKDQKKEMEKLRDALKENTEQMKALLSAHSKTTTVVQELSLEVKEAKWQLQEMQEDNDRGRASIQDKLKEFRSTVEDLQEQLKEAMEDFLDHVNEEGECRRRRRRAGRRKSKERGSRTSS